MGNGLCDETDPKYLEAPAADGPVGAGRGHHAVVHADSQVRHLSVMPPARLSKQPCLCAPQLHREGHFAVRIAQGDRPDLKKQQQQQRAMSEQPKTSGRVAW